MLSLVVVVVVVVIKVSVFVLGISLLHFEGLLGLLLHLMHDCYSMVHRGTVRLIRRTEEEKNPYFQIKFALHFNTSFFGLLFSRNLRLFLSLLMMETQLPVNLPLVSKIKREAVTFGLYEAFLESVPQLILQMSIVLRRGYLSMVY